LNDLKFRNAATGGLGPDSVLKARAGFVIVGKDWILKYG
jgi:hypothetical protein